MIADFMEEHIELARGRLSCANARDEFKRLWAELTNSLNSLGYGTRNTEKWQRVSIIHKKLKKMVEIPFNYLHLKIFNEIFLDMVRL